jgi:hypothetical protein
MGSNTLYFWPIFVDFGRFLSILADFYKNYQKIPENRDLRKKI